VFELLPVAFLTDVLLVDSLTSALAVIAMTLTLAVHARTHLNKLHYYTLSFTGATHINLGASFAVTPLTQNLSIDLELNNLAFIGLLQGDLDLLNSGLQLSLLSLSLSSSSSASSEEHIKYIAKSFTAHALVFQPFKSILII
jgi:hypothetical protein